MGNECLDNLLPSDISKVQALRDLKRIMEDSGYHSDELSDTDFKKAEEERRLGQYVGSDNERHNHVIKVVNKK